MRPARARAVERRAKGYLGAAVVALTALGLVVAASLRMKRQSEAGADPGAREVVGSSRSSGDGVMLERAKRERALSMFRAEMAARGPLLAPTAIAPRGPFLPAAPPLPVSRVPLDRQHLQDGANARFIPLEKQCVANALAVDPDTRGELHVWFAIVDDPAGGALVDRVDVQPDTWGEDGTLRTCILESLMTLSFEETLGGDERVVDMKLDMRWWEVEDDAG
jgi:hypothetical protein